MLPWGVAATPVRWASIFPLVDTSWPLRVGARELIPVELEMAGGHKVHLAERTVPDEDVADSGVATSGDAVQQIDPLRPRADPTAGRWSARTLCGRARGPMVVIVDDVDLLGEHRRLVCRSCWRAVEGWLGPPPPAVGEDDVARWLVETALEVGEALVEEVPAPRVEAIRRRVRSELKAAIGGSVRTEQIGDDGLWVWSGLVNDAKTPERWQHEMRTAVERMWALDDGVPLEPARWRRRWTDITSSQ